MRQSRVLAAVLTVVLSAGLLTGCKQTELASGPYREIQVVHVKKGPLYAEPSMDAKVLAQIPEGTGQTPVLLQKGDGWNKCVVGDRIGFLPEKQFFEEETKSEQVPEFLPEELQLQFIKARNLYNAYYPGAQSGGVGYCDWDRSIDKESFYCADVLYPTKEEWKQALEGVFAPELVRKIMDPGPGGTEPVWKEQDGELYFRQGEWYDLDPSTSIHLVKATKNHIRMEMRAKWVKDQAWQMSAPIELEKGPKGWRFTKFITDQASEWQPIWEQAKEEYAADEAKKAPKDENGNPLGVLYSPAFLSEEQKAVFEDAYDLVDHLYDLSQLGFERVKGEEGTVWCGKEKYYLYNQSYEQIMQRFAQTFSEKCMEKLKNSGVYRDWNGRLAEKMYQFVRRQNQLAINQFYPDRYELVSKTDSKVEFKLITSYTQQENEQDYTNDTKEYPICLIKTKNGWRVDEIHTAAYG